MSELYYTTTRDSGIKVSASQAIIKGLAPDGGLFVPSFIPKLDITLDELKDMSYRETAMAVMKLYLTDFTEEELGKCIDNAYDDKFDTPVIAPLKKAGSAYYLELFHGKTIAFKDMALSILPHLMTTSAKKNGVEDEILILTATSGDTGKAAMAGFADVPGTRIMVFYPKGGVSGIQERQMATQTGANIRVVGVRGNFDDCQSAVKRMFADKELNERIKKEGFVFSSANSINIGRLVPQIVYYVYAYGQLLKAQAIKAGEEIDITVPTGNFGNILAAHYAKRMGLPVNKLICASNENKVLYDFFETGVYDKNREFILTSSPSMDILISSNLERLIYHIAGEDSALTASLMKDLAQKGRYEITKEMKDKLDDFYGGFAGEDKVFSKIKSLYEETGYVLDTHTAVAGAVYDEYRENTKDDRVTVIASTASPYKFATSVLSAIDAEKYKGLDDFALADELSAISKTKIPEAISGIKNAPILHDTVCNVGELSDEVTKFATRKK